MKITKLLSFIGYGALMGLMVFNLMRPKNERIFLAPEKNGSYTQTISEPDFTVILRESDHDFLSISFKPQRDLLGYLFPLVIGVIAGISLFRRKPDGTKSFIADIDSRMVTEHNLYAEFIREDSDRSAFTDEELVAVFSSWLKRHNHT